MRLQATSASLYIAWLSVATVALTLCACDKDSTPTPWDETSEKIYYANHFAQATLSEVYLWNEEIEEQLERLDPASNPDPIGTVEAIRYKENGKEIDKWTLLTDDASSLENQMQGVTTSFGYALSLGQFQNTGTLFFVVNYTYAHSPASEAGLKRGDIIVQIDGEDITEDNYANVFQQSTIALSMGELTAEGIAPSGETIQLTAEHLYENPIIATRIFEQGGQRIGYLAYSSFDLRSAQELVSLCKQFKIEGISQLVLDLRYNGGGYVYTEEVLASMLAPADAVAREDVYETEVWNAKYTAYFQSEGIDLNTYFKTRHTLQVDGTPYITDTQDANLGIDRLYALVGPNTASAAESLLVGLMPYFGDNLTIIGSQTHGKYCTGVILQPEDVYVEAPTAILDWGMYVMVSRYADKNGSNPCMPDGLPADITGEDNPLDGCQLGDAQETLLALALAESGMASPTKQTRAHAAPAYSLQAIDRHPLSGKRIDLKSKELPITRCQ